MTKDWKLGWVQSIEDDILYCILRRDYECDHELRVHVSFLNSDQVDLLDLGSIIQCNLKTKEIKFRENSIEEIWI